jgi:predicted secreted protein with PEFG-CTERM motif
MPISLQIFFEKNLIQVSQVGVTQSGEFTDTFTAAGSQWNNEGTVVIRASYGGDTAELFIDFFKDTTGEYQSIYEVEIPDAGTFDVPYTMKGGTIKSMKLEQKNLSLKIEISTKSDGILELKLLRDNIDSVSNKQQDIDFIVLIYEKDSEIPIETEYKDITSDDDYRAVSIPIRNGDEKIEIIGTYVIPEFGTIAMIILAIAIVSMIAVSAKSRLSTIPKI